MQLGVTRFGQLYENEYSPLGWQLALPNPPFVEVTVALFPAVVFEKINVHEFELSGDDTNWAPPIHVIVSLLGQLNR